MKHITLSLLAVCGMAATQISAAESRVLDSRMVAVAQHDANTPRLTPQQATDKLVKELGLSSKQAKKLSKLNQKYSDLIANPRFNGRPMPANEEYRGDVDARTGATEHAGSSVQSSHHYDGTNEEDVKAHIKSQHEKRNAYNEELKKILTLAQYKQYLGK